MVSILNLKAILCPVVENHYAHFALNARVFDFWTLLSSHSSRLLHKGRPSNGKLMRADKMTLFVFEIELIALRF